MTATTTSTTTGLRLGAVTFDTTGSASDLAGFWSSALGRPIADGALDQVALINGDGDSPALLFLQVPDRTPGKNSVHLDLIDPDYPAQVTRLVGLGAKRIGDFDDWGITWTTLADPEGNLFDVAKVHD